MNFLGLNSYDQIPVNVDTNADFMVIIKEDAINPQKCILIDDTKEIVNYLNSYKWHDKHLVCCFDAGHSDYTINAVKNDYISEQIYFDNKWEVGPYNSDFFNKTKIYIRPPRKLNPSRFKVNDTADKISA